MTFLVKRPIDWISDHARRVVLDLGRRFEVCADELAQVIGVISGICDDMADALQTFDQAACLRAIPPLTRRNLEPDGQTERTNGSVDLRRQAALGPSDGVSFKPPF